MSQSQQKMAAMHDSTRPSAARLPLIRNIKESDFLAIYAIQQRVYLPSLREEVSVLKSKWQASPLSCFVAQDEGGALAAYLLAHPWSGESPPQLNESIPVLKSQKLFIHDLSIDQAAQGSGLGRYMFGELLRRSQAQNFEQMQLVAVQNSQAFWAQFGFQVIARLPASKGYGGSAVSMALNL